ncbi:hypothetical protein HispidOSU_022194, partial [Sigmodon hispidus]
MTPEDLGDDGVLGSQPSFSQDVLVAESIGSTNLDSRRKNRASGRIEPQLCSKVNEK